MLTEPYIKCAVISDLHCQREEKSAKITRLHTKLLDNPIHENPVEALKKIIDENQKKVDYFFVLGDITDKADVEGFVLGVKFIKELFQSLDASALIYAIGNHDITLSKEDESQFQDPSYLMKRTNGFPLFFKNKEESNLDIQNEFWSHNNCIVEDSKSIILILNTSCFMHNPQKRQPLIIDETIIAQIKSKLDKIESSNKLRIAICHHHPIATSDFNDNYTPLDCIGQGDKLTSLLKEYNFSLFMHGHKHFPLLRNEDNLPIFCSGSFSSLENTVGFNVQNTAHFINFYQTETSPFFKGTIETWVYNSSKGWILSKNIEADFPSQTGFGVNINIREYVNSINAHFYKDLVGTDAMYIPIPITKIKKEFPDISFLTPIQQDAFVKELEKNNITLQQDKKGNMSINKNYQNE